MGIIYFTQMAHIQFICLKKLISTAIFSLFFKINFYFERFGKLILDKMKEIIIVLLFVVLSISMVNAQQKVHVSDIEERNIGGQMVLYADNQKYEGIVYENYVKPKLKYTVKEGRMNGPYELFYENGRLKRKTTFKDDKYHGPYEEFYENGQLAIKTFFKSGKYHGSLQMYYKNGQLEAEGNHIEGSYDGRQRKYYENGKLKSSISYVFGAKEGPSIK